MMRKPTFVFFFLLSSISIVQVNAQATKANNDPDATFKEAKELYANEQLSLAYPLFKALYNGNHFEWSNFPASEQLEVKYYAIACGLKLNDATAEPDAKTFVEAEHNTPRVQMMSYQLAEYYYRKKDFTDAITYYEKAGIDNLSNTEIANSKFHEAYGYFTMQRFSEAKPLFNSIRQIPGDPDYIDANYYYGFIVFGEKNYKEALTAFKMVQDKPAYQSIVPYYVTEIYYFTGNRDSAIASGEKALQTGNQYYNMQLKQLLGHAYFDKKEFAKAQPYLADYISKTPKVSREDLYELSFTYYQVQDWNKAITGFKELGGKQDSLAQNSMYLLGDAYLKTNQKASARSAFLFCALNSSNATQKEISKFLYAKLSYELGYEDVALTELQNFIASYRNSAYNTEAKELLVNVLANTNNYKEALSLYQSLNTQTESALRAYPRILYGRATELINEQQVEAADELLNYIFTADYNDAQKQPAYFWKGELSFRLNDADSAIYYFTTYLRNPVSYGEVNSTDARYTLGYAYMDVEDYASALKNFEQITSIVSPASSNIQQDAFVRSADCNFMQKRYSKALQSYENIIALNLPAADYAFYQKAIIAGAANQTTEKLNLLKTFTQRYASSVLVPDANMEIANTYMANEEYNNAIAPLNTIIANKNAVSFKPQAYLKLGVCYFNMNNNDGALNSFKTLMSSYSNTDESNEAVEYVRNIFISRQQPDQFIAFMRQNGKDVSKNEQDSLTYTSAYISYTNKDVNGALKGFQSYLTQFPEGRYAVDAGYLTGSIFYDRKDYANALTYFIAVADKAPNKYAEFAVLQAARIYYFEQNDYTKAEQYYTQLKTIATGQDTKLESMRGLLRCQYKLSQFTDAVPNAQDLLTQKGLATDDKMMADMIIAKSYQANNQLDDATAAYSIVAGLGKSEYAAEARYRIAEILFGKGDFKKAEKAGFDVINKAGSYNYWITKAYILLGDVYYREGDYFNAEATLKSVVENAEDDTLKQEAQQKLDIVVKDKNKNSKVEQTLN